MSITIKGTRPEENLTGGQIQQVMDKILYDAVYLLTPHGVFDNILVTILSSLVLDKRRKISSAAYDEGINLLCNLTLRSSPDAFEDLKQLKLERTVYLKILNQLVLEVEDSGYIKLYHQWLTTRKKVYDKRLKKIEASIGIERPYLFYIYFNIKANLDTFMKFKSSILQQYINLTHKYASAHIKHKNMTMNYDDLFQNIVAAVSKAIDKYDSSKGALTSYIKYWIINALNLDNSHGEGLAYEVTYTQRQKIASGQSSDVNISSSLSDKENDIADDATPESVIEKKSSVDRVLRLIKVADPDGIFRLVNNIDEFFTRHELADMKSHMEKEAMAKARAIISKRGTLA